MFGPRFWASLSISSAVLLTALEVRQPSLINLIGMAWCWPAAYRFVMADIRASQIKLATDLLRTPAETHCSAPKPNE